MDNCGHFIFTRLFICASCWSLPTNQLTIYNKSPLSTHSTPVWFPPPPPPFFFILLKWWALAEDCFSPLKMHVFHKIENFHHKKKKFTSIVHTQFRCRNEWFFCSKNIGKVPGNYFLQIRIILLQFSKFYQKNLYWEIEGRKTLVEMNLGGLKSKD
jgi:hypothetical protein